MQQRNKRKQQEEQKKMWAPARAQRIRWHFQYGAERLKDRLAMEKKGRDEARSRMILKVQEHQEKMAEKQAEKKAEMQAKRRLMAKRKAEKPVQSQVREEEGRGEGGVVMQCGVAGFGVVFFGGGGHARTYSRTHRLRLPHRRPR